MYNLFDHKPGEIYFDNRGNLIVKNGTLYYYRNFSAKDINGAIPEGAEQKDSLRSFKIFVDDEAMANQLSEMGYSISMSKPDANEKVHYILKCKVSYKFFAPKIIMHKANGQEFMRTIDDIADVDNDPILNESIGLILRPSKYRTKAGKEGTSAYVQEMHYMVDLNPFDGAYQKMFPEMYPQNNESVDEG